MLLELIRAKEWFLTKWSFKYSESQSTQLILWWLMNDRQGGGSLSSGTASLICWVSNKRPMKYSVNLFFHLVFTSGLGLIWVGVGGIKVLVIKQEKEETIEWVNEDDLVDRDFRHVHTLRCVCCSTCACSSALQRCHVTCNVPQGGGWVGGGTENV